MIREFAGFADKAVFGLGIALVINSALIVISGAVCAGIYIEQYEELFSATGGTEFWIPVICSAAGITSILAGRCKSNGYILANMIVTIMAAMMAFILLSVCLKIAFATVNFTYYGYFIIALLAVTDMMLAIASSAMCCRTLCCGREQYSPTDGASVQSNGVANNGKLDGVIVDDVNDEPTGFVVYGMTGVKSRTNTPPGSEEHRAKLDVTPSVTEEHQEKQNTSNVSTPPGGEVQESPDLPAETPCNNSNTA